MNEKLKELLDNSIDCLKQVHSDISAKAEQQRKLDEAKLQAEQRLLEQQFYQNPYPLVLSNGQYRLLERDFYYSEAAILPLDVSQSIDITKHLINQAKLNNDVALLKAIREEASVDLNSNFDIARLIHVQFFESFIHAYYPHLTYADVTPIDCSVIVYRDYYGFVYSLAVDRKIVYETVKDKFKRFKNTQYCQKLFRQYNISKAKIGFDSQNYNLIIFLK